MPGLGGDKQVILFGSGRRYCMKLTDSHSVGGRPRSQLQFSYVKPIPVILAVP